MSTFTLAVQLTMIDLLSAGVRRARENILSLSGAGKQVQGDFDRMTNHVQQGLKGLAVTKFAWDTLSPAVDQAKTLQATLIGAKMALSESGKSASTLARELAAVKASAVTLQKDTPFGATSIVGAETALLKAGVSVGDVTAEGGAGWAASMLAALENASPEAMAEGVASIGAVFGAKGKEYKKIANDLSKVSDASISSATSLIQGMAYAGGAAANANQSATDTAVALGLLSQKGLKGDMGGTALRSMFSALSLRAPKALRGEDGKVLPLPQLLKVLQGKLSGLPEQQRMQTLQKLLGDVNAVDAATKLMSSDWDAFVAKMDKAADLSTKVKIRMEGAGASVDAMKTSWQTTLGLLAEPVLTPMKAAADAVNTKISALGQSATDGGTGATVARGVGGAALAGGGLYAFYHLIQGARSAGVVLGKLGGFGGLLKGLARTGVGTVEGKMVEAATGVTPVFVTNWPAGGGSFGSDAVGGVVGAVGAGLGAKGAGKLLARLAGASGLGWGTVGVGVGAAAGLGVAAGSVLNAGIDALDGAFGTKIGERIGRSVAAVMSLFSEDARRALDREKNGARPINVTVDVAADGRSFVTTDDRQAKTTVNLKRGHLK